MARQREHWSSKFGMFMAAAGSAIGLGTLWKFPYVTGENGGGAFIYDGRKTPSFRTGM